MEKQVEDIKTSINNSNKKSIFELRKKVLSYFVNKNFSNDSIDKAISSSMAEQNKRIKGYSK